MKLVLLFVLASLAVANAAYGSTTTWAPAPAPTLPNAPANLAHVCSYDELIIDYKRCEIACRPAQQAGCYGGYGPPNCVQYYPCENLVNGPSTTSAPNNYDHWHSTSSAPNNYNQWHSTTSAPNNYNHWHSTTPSPYNYNQGHNYGHSTTPSPYNYNQGHNYGHSTTAATHPPAPSNLAHLCSYEELKYDRKRCENACAPAMYEGCPYGNGPATWCATYSACQNLENNAPTAAPTAAPTWTPYNYNHWHSTTPSPYNYNQGHNYGHSTTAGPSDQSKNNDESACGEGTKMQDGKCVVNYSGMKEMCSMASRNGWGWTCKSLSQCPSPSPFNN